MTLVGHRSTRARATSKQRIKKGLRRSTESFLVSGGPAGRFAQSLFLFWASMVVRIASNPCLIT